jgi:hypothetical protein
MNYLKTSIFAIFALCAVATTSCGDKDNTVAVTGIEVTSTPSPFVLAVGATGKVEAAVLPADATDKRYTWSVLPEGVVEVAADGTVTAVGPGYAVITATATADGNMTDGVDNSATGTIDVTVNTILDGARIEFSLNEDETAADMKMLQVTFATAMHPMDITVPGATVVKTAEGYSISGEGIVPTTVMRGNTIPVAVYTITDFSGTLTTEKLSFEMMCGAFPLSYTGTREADNGAFRGTLTVAPQVKE